MRRVSFDKPEQGLRSRGDRYETTWSEMDVSCEACHGPGSRHVDWANAAAIGRDTPYDNGDFGLEIASRIQAGAPGW